ncbi:hypothetical protein CPB84DRAFT_1764277 [Gymnopilus junonius]|uniref:Uncharacterized protein n=1 Tax=Gymnopilus junonius TaxID=109634 RepID=A0A9P5P0K7_GYMJU|nr:hypothetical protein CPB84DRAFT_1764277 [Gymnopilus junonius]
MPEARRCLQLSPQFSGAFNYLMSPSVRNPPKVHDRLLTCCIQTRDLSNLFILIFQARVLQGRRR